jgi:deazaflavin-dependent oxidoreductase (nitroreductase family)
VKATMSARTLDPLAGERLCYLETIGRTSGRRHEIEIWFAVDGGMLYLLAGGGERADWVKNVRRNPNVRVRIRDTWLSGSARVITGEAQDPHAREVVQAKYANSGEGDLSEWARNSTPVAVEGLGVGD